MDCPHCGASIAAFPCAVCGAEGGVARTRVGSGYAGWWKRVGATFFDNVVLFLPVYALFVIGDSIGGSVLGVLLGLVAQGAYLIGLLSRPGGQTLGNRVMNTRVRDAVSGGPITRQQAVRRWLVVALYSSLELASSSSTVTLFSVIALVDCLYPLFNPMRQTWHDRLAGTVVLQV